MRARLWFAVILALPIVSSCTKKSNQEQTRPPSTQMANLMEEAAVPAGMIRIGSWNMGWLGPSNHTPAERRSPQDLAEYIARSGAAVIALQEVGETPGSPRRNATLNNVAQVLADQGGADWDYLLFPTQLRDQSGCTGVMWNKRLVSLVGRPYAIPVRKGEKGLDEALIWERLPHAVKFSTGKSDFVIVPIHTKSSRIADPDSSHRVHEIRLLAMELDGVRRHFDDRDLILAGDFNTGGSGETTVMILLKQGFKDINSNDELTYISGAPFDRVFVPKDQPEFARATQIRRVSSPGMSLDQFRRRLSDHYLITFDVRASGDDD
jgi:endonuclease/exonuclease/phosphatase family metal-dependent hydrolase